MASRSLQVLVPVILLAVVASAILLGEACVQHGQSGTAQAFQHLVGGAGFGPTVELSDCAFGFDPRLDGNCAQECGPVPGGTCFCPRHAGSVFYYSPLDQGLSLPGAEDGDAFAP
jgi:hypothetical protein